MDYWGECIEQAFEEAGIKATQEQIKIVSDAVEGAHENYSMAYPIPENPLAGEVKRLSKALSAEKEKRVCPDCMGDGIITDNFLERSSTTQCFKCKGEGKI